MLTELNSRKLIPVKISTIQVEENDLPGPNTILFGIFHEIDIFLAELMRHVM